MSMLSKLLSMSKTELQTTLQSVDASAVKGRGLRRRFEKIRGKQGGFTLLELLVVVAILAAIAGSASLMLHDTDRRASAGAHVFAMGQIANAVNTYKILNAGKFPDNWDSLLATGTTTGEDLLSILSPDVAGEWDTANSVYTGDLAIRHLDTELGGAGNGSGSPTIRKLLTEAGITSYRVLAGSGVKFGSLTCENANLEGIVKNKDNDVVPINIYKVPANETTTTGTFEKGGCGKNVSFAGSGTYAAGHWEDSSGVTLPAYASGAIWVPGTYTAGSAAANYIVTWTGDHTRINTPELEGGGEVSEKAVIVALGVGPGTDLLDPSTYGGLTSVPVYRHVEPHEYAGYIVLLRVDGEKGTVTFAGVIDGAGDTKDEELGELDNLRNT
jgi:prepilin-type N-terminal cleavage/methylation domain-containing protein